MIYLGSPGMCGNVRVDLGDVIFKMVYVIVHSRNESPSTVVHITRTAGAEISTTFQ